MKNVTDLVVIVGVQAPAVEFVAGSSDRHHVDVLFDGRDLSLDVERVTAEDEDGECYGVRLDEPTVAALQESFDAVKAEFEVEKTSNHCWRRAARLAAGVVEVGFGPVSSETPVVDMSCTGLLDGHRCNFCPSERQCGRYATAVFKPQCDCSADRLSLEGRPDWNTASAVVGQARRCPHCGAPEEAVAVVLTRLPHPRMEEVRKKLGLS
jgi:hypothetical protein